MRFLSKATSTRTRFLSERLLATRLWNTFNPSIVRLGDDYVVAFRAGLHPGDKPFGAFLILPDTPHGQYIDLTTAFSGSKSGPVCDPKLFRRGEEIWLTFNTGHFEAHNRIFIARVHPDLGTPQEVLVERRNPIEKNWGFFQQAGQLSAVYAAVPSITLRETLDDADGIMRMEHTSSADNPSADPRFSIGPQPQSLGDGRFVTIVHRKKQFFRKRLYVGQVAVMSPAEEGYDVTLLPDMLAHSGASLLGERPKHNKNLLSCTYFSGLSIENDTALISYGVNDLRAGFAEVTTTSLGL